MLVIYNTDDAIRTLLDEFGKLSDNYYLTFKLVGDELYRKVQGHFPFLPTLEHKMLPENDYNGYYAKMAKLEEKNKSRAKFVNVYYYQVYLDQQKCLCVDLSYSGIHRILSVDGNYLYIGTNYRHPVIESLSLFDDNREYRKHLPYGYEEQHPNPTSKITVLTDAVLDKWMDLLIEKAKEYDDIVYHENRRNYEFIQHIEDHIDPKKCDSYEVAENKGRIVANGLVLRYDIDDDGNLTWGLDIYEPYRINCDNVVDRFMAMTNTEK